MATMTTTAAGAGAGTNPKIRVNTVSEAVDSVASILTNAGYRNLLTLALRNGSHWKISAVSPDTGKEVVFYVKWQKELFYKARLLVPELKGTGTRGACTLNVEYAEEALASNCVILFASKDDQIIYEVDAKSFMLYSGKYTQSITGEVEKCIAVERLKRWTLLKKGDEPTILVLKCVGTLKDGTPCGYARVQTKQDIYATELKMLRDCHSKTFDHKMKGLRIPRSDPLAQELRKRLQYYERW